MPRTSPTARTLAAVALAAVATGAAGTAHAADSYRYWGFYHLEGTTWQFAQKGVQQEVPADGAVEGFRYAVGDGSIARNPRAVATFQEVCGTTTAPAGSKRVGIVVDFGRAADARDAGASVPKPYARCAVVPQAATSADALAAVAKTRVENKMLCGIDGYPATGCSDVVKTLTPEQKAADDLVALPVPAAGGTPSAAASSAVAPASEGGNGTAAWAGLAALVLAGAAAAAALVSRRNRGTRA